MKRLMISCVALAAFAAPAFAGSTIATKTGEAPIATILLGNFGQANAQYTGNGAAVSGNGNTTDLFGVQIDQTPSDKTLPGRGQLVQEALEELGLGSLK